MTAAALLLVTASLLLAPARQQQTDSFVTSSVTTYYDDVGLMADGNWVHDGAAACPIEYLGATVHVLEPDVWLVCEDTGDPAYFEAGYFRLDVWAAERPWWLDADWYDVEVFP